MVAIFGVAWREKRDNENDEKGNVHSIQSMKRIRAIIQCPNANSKKMMARPMSLPMNWKKPSMAFVKPRGENVIPRIRRAANATRPKTKRAMAKGLWCMGFIGKAQKDQKR
jgi:hypothetical protein